MKYILDTNIHLQLIELNHSHHKQAGEALKTLRRQNNIFYVLLQSVFESWNVCTRPADKKGVGLSIAKSDVHLKKPEHFFKLLPDTGED